MSKLSRRSRPKWPRMTVTFPDLKGDRAMPDDEFDRGKIQGDDELVVVEFKVSAKGMKTIKRAIDKIGKDLPDNLDPMRKRALCLDIMARRALLKSDDKV